MMEAEWLDMLTSRGVQIETDRKRATKELIVDIPFRESHIYGGNAIQMKQATDNDDSQDTGYHQYSDTALQTAVQTRVNHQGINELREGNTDHSPKNQQGSTISDREDLTQMISRIKRTITVV